MVSKTLQYGWSGSTRPTQLLRKQVQHLSSRRVGVFMRRLFAPLLLTSLLAAAPASAQIQSRPTDQPIVTANNESWYLNREPVQFGGDLYYPAGATVFFNGNHMVRSGHYNGVRRSTDPTIEPFSIVYVPLERGMMQPYERVRQGSVAGTTASRPPSFPVVATPTTTPLPQAGAAPTAPPDRKRPPL